MIVNNETVPDDDAVVSAITLKDVLDRCEAFLVGTALRDTRSAFRMLEKAGVELHSIVAQPNDLRILLEKQSAVALGVSAKRFANMSALLRSAVAKFGMRRSRISIQAKLSEEWTNLLATIMVREYRWGLGRFAAYCTDKGIAPHEVTSKVLIGFEAAVEADSLIKNPKDVRKNTIRNWNACSRQVPGWPQETLASPFKPDVFMFPLAAFPESFLRDIDAFEERNRNPDPLDLSMPLRAMRPDTLENYRFTFRRLASVLVREHSFPLSAMTSLAVLVEVDNLKNALRYYVPANGKPTAYVHKMATQMLAIARDFLVLPAEELETINALVKRLKPRGQAGMGKRNRDRLAQFDDEQVVVRLLKLPGDELARAMKMSNPLRRAKAVERALMLSLSIFASFRPRSMGTLRLDHNLRRQGNRLFIELFEDDTKTHAALTLEMPPETLSLLDLFVAEHRPLLPGSEGPYLFPGAKGGARSYSAIHNAVGVHVSKMAGIDISPHGYRHFVAKIVVGRQPELLFDVSRRLGHKSIAMTSEFYLGTDASTASRHINGLLQNMSAKKLYRGAKKRGSRR
jgi:integrase